MSSLGKIHLVKPAFIGKQTYTLDERNETYCGKIMKAKYVTVKPEKTTCKDCLKEKFPTR